MRIFGNKNSGSTGGEKMNPLLYLIVFIPLLFIEGARICMGRVYDGWAGAFRAFLGVIFGFGGAMYAGNLAGWQWGWPWYGWLPAAAVGFSAVLWYLWPLLYRFVVGPAIDLVDAIYDGTREFLRKNTGPACEAVVNLLSTVCVGSGPAWRKVLSSEHSDTWVAKLGGAIAYLAGFGCTGYIAWSAYTAVGAAVTWPVFGFALAVFAGIVTFGVLFGLYSQLMKYGKFAFAGLAIGVLAVWGGAPYVVALTGTTGLWSWAAYAAAYVVFVGYVFPLLNVLLTLGLLEKLWNFLKPLPEKTYDDPSEEYREFFHHVVNILTTGGLTYFAWVFAVALSLPFWAAIAIPVVVALLSYVLVYKLIGHDSVNFIVGALVSVASGYKAFACYTAAGYVFGVYGAITAAVVTLLATGFLLFPLVYVTLRFVLHGLGISRLGVLLTDLYLWVNDQFKAGIKQIGRAYTECYDDKGPFPGTVLHVANLVATAAGVFGMWKLAALLGTGSVLALLLTVVAGALIYLYVGKALLKSSYGLETLGIVLALIAGWTVGTAVYAELPAGVLRVGAFAAGIATWFAVFFVVVPVVFVLARLLTGWALNPTIRPALQWVFDFLWSGFDVVLTQLKRAYNALKQFLTPFWLRLVAAGRAVREAYQRLLRLISRR